MTRRKIRRTTKPKIRYEDYQYMIQKRVNYYYSTTKLRNHIEREELMSQANVIFCQAVNDYKPEIGSFSTYLWYRLKYLLYIPKHLFSFFLSNTSNTIPELTDPICILKQCAFHEMLSNLSAEAKDAINIVANSNIPTNTGRWKYGKFTDYLITEKNWEWSVATKAVREIKEGLRAL